MHKTIFQRLLRYTLVFFVLFSASGLRAQDTKDVNARSPNTQPANRQEKKALKTKDRQKKELNKAIEKGRKRHEKIQSKDVRKRMKKSKRRAASNHAHERDFFLKRWFTPGPKKRSR